VRRLYGILALALFAAATPLMASEPVSAPACCSPGSIETASDVSELPPVPEQKESPGLKFVIKKLAVPHCKRGPEYCELCRKNAEPRWCLLDVDPPDKDMVQRPVIELSIDNERHFLVYDVIKSFTSEEEAHQYMAADDHHNILWDSNP